MKFKEEEKKKSAWHQSRHTFGFFCAAVSASVNNNFASCRREPASAPIATAAHRPANTAAQVRGTPTLPNAR